MIAEFLVSEVSRIDLNSPYTWAVFGLGSTLFLHKKTIRGDVAFLAEVAIFFIICAIHYFTQQQNVLSASSAALSAVFFHLVTIVLATVSYRVSPFHPLWKFPGPLINKMTSIEIARAVYSGKCHNYMDNLHKKYGTFVRTGPNTLSINSHEAINPIYASSSSFDKSDAYTPGRVEGNGLFFTKSKEIHNIRRRIWAGGFTPQTLSNYKPVVEKRIYGLAACIDVRRDATGVVDLSQAIQHWSYDVMGDLAFGGSSNLEMMEGGDTEHLIESGQAATLLFETFGQVPSLFDIATYLPVTGNIKKLENAAEKMLVARESDATASDNDFVSHLLGHHTSMPKIPFSDRRVDSLFAIQAGSDSTSGTIINMVAFLIANPHAYKKLQEELDTAFPNPDDPVSLPELVALPYLTAVIHESLRLGSPVPGLPRVVPKSGLVIEGKFIPPGTIVGINTYVMDTSPRNFYPDPLSYKPERFLPDGLGPGTITRKISSFSFGAFGCLGRNLAIQEMQLVISRLMLTFDLKFAPGFDLKKWKEGTFNVRGSVFTSPLLVVATNRR